MALNRPKPPSIGPVAELLAMDRTTLTAAIKPLERRGLLLVQVDPGDRRGRLLSLTAEGHRLLAKAVPIWKHHHAEIEKQLRAPDVLRQELGKLCDTRQWAPPHIEAA
jgi:DNA-binding MarR family transcriptional regulator